MINALIESDQIETLKGSPLLVMTMSESGCGQQIWRCPDRQVALWSNYGGAKDILRLVRVGALDEPGEIEPDIHNLHALETALGPVAGGHSCGRSLL